MESIIDLLHTFESSKNLEISSLKFELKNLNILNNDLLKQNENLKMEISNLHIDKKDMQSVSIIVKLTNEKIEFKNENELLKKTNNYLKKTIKDMNKIKYAKSTDIIITEVNNTENTENTENTLHSTEIKNNEIEAKTIVLNNNFEKIDDIWNNQINVKTIEVNENNSKNIIKNENNDNHIIESDSVEYKLIDTNMNNNDTNISIENNMSNDKPNDNIKEINIGESISSSFIDNNIHYQYKKIKGIKYLIDNDKNIYNIDDTENIIGEYKLNKKNILRPVFY
jgi:hypothetical protein